MNGFIFNYTVLDASSEAFTAVMFLVEVF